MARLPEGTFKQWKDGDVVNARDYTQELEIIRAAVNDNYERVNVLEGAAGGEIKRIPFGTTFPPSPISGDIFFRTDENILYVLDTMKQWRAFSPKTPTDAHINSKENPHAVTASQVGAYSKLETDMKFIPKNGHGWVGMPGYSGWRTYTGGGNFNPVQYTMDSLGWVVLRGCLDGGSANTQISEIPSGYRPAHIYSFPVVTNGGFARVNVQPDGGIFLVGDFNSYIFFDGIRFLAG